MSNPVFSQKILNRTAAEQASGVMTIKGTITKTFILTLMVFLGAAYTWKVFNEAINPASLAPWMWGGLIGGFVLALIISFNPKSAQYLSPIYAILEGFFLGAISAIYNAAFAEIAPGIIMNAILLTLMVTFAMLFVYRTNIIKVDGKFAKVMFMAISAIALYYILNIVLRFFGVHLTMLHDGGLLSIGISIVIVVVAAFTLLLDFNFIEKASYARAPKYMEWYGAFGLMVTLVWLYLEILRLLGKFANR